MQVAFTYEEASGEYEIDAEVSPKGKVIIVTVSDSYGEIIDLDEFAEDETEAMKQLALQAYRDILAETDDDEEEEDEGYEAQF